MKIGVLDIQGAVAEHISMLKQFKNVEAIRAKTVEELNEIDGLILPGGESTAIAKMLNFFNLTDLLRKRINEGVPVWGTCAGMILLAKEIEGEDAHLAVMDIKVRRNAYGSQLDSFITEKEIPEISSQGLPLVFIRAPYILEHQENVCILAKVDENIVAARQGNMFVTSFHPELSGNKEFHKYFLDIVGEHKGSLLKIAE